MYILQSSLSVSLYWFISISFLVCSKTRIKRNAVHKDNIFQLKNSYAISKSHWRVRAMWAQEC